MAKILPILSPHSQFPYPYDKPQFLASCRIRSGKMNVWKRRYICISRNCMYYYHNEEGLLDQAEEEDSEYMLPTGVVPLWKCDCMVCAEEVKKTKVRLLKKTSDDVHYVRLLSKERLVERSKPFFEIQFGRRGRTS